MELKYRLPRPDLRDYIRAYYLFETDARVVQPMCAELANVRFLLAGAGAVRVDGRAPAPVTPATLIGPTLKAYSMEAEAGSRVFGMGILPRGWQALFGVSAEALADRVEDLTAIAGRIAANAVERLHGSAGLTEMADAADAFFSELRDSRDAAAGSRYPAVLERWMLDPRDPSLDDLMAAMDLSQRQTDRLAKTFFGASPKMLQRKHRALRAADRILFGRARGWIDAAGPAYYDQSHFIKEFKTFLGATPRDYAADSAGLTAIAKVRRREELARHPLAGL